MLTTITPYWNRPKMLELWLRALHRARHPKVEHIVLVAGEPIPPVASSYPHVRFVPCQGGKEYRPSIGYFHNMGAQMAETEWMMKLDVDALPNEIYFYQLLDVLEDAGEREWFNGGMFYVNKETCSHLLSRVNELLCYDLYCKVIRNVTLHCSGTYRRPAASNFICRRADYLRLGGCSQGFVGYGWEDYQQMYMLERYQQGKDPLQGTLDIGNVTERCRDEISRPKAMELFQKNDALALLHHWHPGSHDPRYKTPQIVARNRDVLLHYILTARLTNNCVS